VATWSEIEIAEPDFARAVRERLDAGVHKTIATLRADGSPRISGIEAFVAEGDLWFGSMPRARKAIDLQRDPRFALHGASTDPPAWDGDAKLSGHAEEVTEPERRLRTFRSRGSDPPSPDSHLFRAEITEVVLVGLNEARDRLVLEHWHGGRGLQRTERE
jgi:Pyridoxamine 5'-phosphate oxidase